MKLKRIAALLLALIMVFALVACNETTNETKAPDGTKAPDASGEPVKTDAPPVNPDDVYELKVKLWVPDKAMDLTKKQIEDFNATNTWGIKVIPEIDALSEADAATQVLLDVTTAPDIYFFAQDQFARLVQGGALAQVPADMVATVEAENNAGVVNSGKSGDTLYAYPLTNDNGYFMYYDKSVIPEADVDSLEKLIEDCENAKKYFAFEQDTSAWYNASFFFGVGCRSSWVTDDDGNFVEVYDDFNSDKGLIAVKGMEKLVKSDYFLSSSAANEFANGAAIVVTGTWAYEDIKGILGDNLGATDLPSFEVDGKSYHLGSFSGCKLLGVKPQSDGDRQAALHILAEYLTSEAAQLERFNELAWGPANNAAANDPAVLANPGLVALSMQNQYAVPQGQIHGSWWDIAKIISKEVKEAKSEEDLKAALQNYYDKISALFTMSEEDKNAWGVIGSICGTSWDTDFPMSADGVLYKSETLELKAGDELKCRQGGSWDNNFPADNVVVEADGFYIVVLDPNAGTVTLEPAAAPSWGVVGSMTGWGSDPDYPMTEAGASYVSDPIELKAGDELKCRFNSDWAENYGADGKDGANVKVEADGTYTVLLDLVAGTVTLQPAG